MPIARIQDGAIIDRREVSIDDIPPHKRSGWVPVVVDGDGPVATEIVEADRVRIVRSDVGLSTLKQALRAEIDLAAEASRLRYMTPGSGQALEYREAAEEAARYAATSGAGEYPMLQASVDAGEVASLAAAAALVTQREAAWATVGAQIRRLRIAAKAAVSAATTHAAARAAAQVTWP